MAAVMATRRAARQAARGRVAAPVLRTSGARNASSYSNRRLPPSLVRLSRLLAHHSPRRGVRASPAPRTRRRGGIAAPP